MIKKMLPRQIPKIFTFRVKLGDSIFFLLFFSPMSKVNIFKPFMMKILFNSLRNCKDT